MADSFKELVLESKEFASQKPFRFRRAAGDSDFGSFEDCGSPMDVQFLLPQCLNCWFHHGFTMGSKVSIIEKRRDPLFNGGKDTR